MQAFDVIVIGGGHAGCEAAMAAARMGAATALITLRGDDIGMLSCNPAIGGVGKGHLVREIDALDGVIGRVADAAAVQYRLLNRSKGPAVQGPRVQVDRKRYSTAMQAAVVSHPGLTVIEASVNDLVIDDDGSVTGVEASIGPISGRSVVITTGTFLAATMHSGTASAAGGRHGGAAATGLAAALGRAGLPMTRFKTGTPPRLDGRTIDWARLDMQHGDEVPVGMSDTYENVSSRPYLPCGVTRTNPRTHAIIRQNIGLAPMYSGRIGSVGPRYCPSIEDKVMRFGDRDGHQIFLEPEGFDDVTVYPNGISTSLPADIQLEFIQTIVGLERVRILRPGYAVDYRIVDPRALTHVLAVRNRRGLFLAGQINGTTGYEEAAAQGVVAGINAARTAFGQPPMIFDRGSSYIGVMIDDLVTAGVSEPYRIFTSRAEFRLSLRIDNAAARLTALGIGAGVIGRERRLRFAAQQQEMAEAQALLAELKATPARIAADGYSVNQDGRARSAAEWLAHPAIDWSAARRIWPILVDVAPSIAATLSTDMNYSIYLDRQAEAISRFRRDESLGIPSELDFQQVAGLSAEMVERLQTAAPSTLGAAKRIAGITPGALMALLAHTRRAA